MSSVLIASEGLTKRYGTSLTAYESLTVSIGRGEFAVFVGKSGCGKTSLLRSFAGLNAPSEGVLRFDGQPVYDAAGRPSRLTTGQIGFVFQEPNLLQWRTVRENIRLPLEIGRLPEQASDRVSSLAAAVGLEAFLDAFPAQLSGGMRQRAALARALICRPSLLLMDEPFGALDAITRESMNELLESVWLSTNATVVLVTHSIAEAVLLADRIFVMTPHPGRLKSVHPVAADRPRTRSWLQTAEATALAGRIKQELDE